MMLIGWLVSLQKRRERRGEHDVIREDLIPATVEMNMFKLIFFCYLLISIEFLRRRNDGEATGTPRKSSPWICWMFVLDGVMW